MTKAIFFLIFTLVAGAAHAIEFDAGKAWDNLLAQVNFGPRPPGGSGHNKCLAWLESELKKYATVERQGFIGREGVSGKSLSLTNLIAHIPGKRPERVLLCAHWDTRPWADMDPEPANRSKPIPGANDGASGVAVLLEIARCLSLQKPSLSVDIVLFDGEDLGREGHLEEYLQGSRAYARSLKFPLPSAAILLDMVGDRDLAIPQELYSLNNSPDLVREVFDLAARLNVSAFHYRPGNHVYDDHIPLIETGIPSVDLIDFDYPWWHTLEDTPDKCSPQSLGAVGKVVLAWVYSRR
jgi:Zn-dependent M28 family amino/carboxypeptidase